jgi:hypothetical protein
MDRRLLSLALLSLLLTSLSAWAEEAPSAWSLYSGRTVGAEANVLATELGWPGLQGTYVHGVSDRLDVGGKVALDYGLETTLRLNPAVALQAVVRFGLVNRERFSLAVEIEPGLGFYVGAGGGVTIYLPAALQMGLHPLPGLALLFGLELRPKISFAFTNGVVFGMPILLLDPGVEYAILPRVALTARLGFGPGVFAGGGISSGVGLSFRALAGVSFLL